MRADLQRWFEFTNKNYSAGSHVGTALSRVTYSV